MPAPSFRIGVDFDNTLVCYDEAFDAVAREEKLLAADAPPALKSQVRDAVRALENGEYHWQRLQGLVYGRLINRARLFEGAMSFLAQAMRTPGTEVFIVSHKTELAHHDPLKTNLRDAARGFLEANGFFGPLGLKPEQVFFEPTREEKLARIAQLGCHVFIDDLPEVLLDPNFPAACEPLLFSGAPQGGLKHFSSWKAIHDHLFRAAA